jgi:hypothetical protein
MNLGIIEIGAAAGAIMAIVGMGTWIKRIITTAVKPIKDLEKALQANNAANRAALRYSITRAHREYVKDGAISRYALECIIDMHTQYKALGGNGFVDAIVEEVKSLRVEL